MPVIGGTVFDSAGVPVDRELRFYRRDTGVLLGKSRSSGGDGGAGDEHFDKVALLLHMDGADGSTAFVDSSPSPKTVTPTGDVKVSTAQSRFGEASAYFPGSGRLDVADSPGFNFGSGDFTLEMFVSFSTVRSAMLLQQSDDVSGYVLKWSLYFHAKQIHLQFLNPATTIHTIGPFGTWTPVAGTWYHVVVSRQGTAFRAFIDGVQLGATATSSAVMPDVTLPLRIGAAYDPPLPMSGFHGHIDDLRVTKDVARYTANFTPPAAPFPDTLLPGRTMPLGEYYFATSYTGEVQVVCVDDASEPLENDLILRTFPV